MLSAEPGAKAPVASRRVFIGPANSAGQGYAWARAISRHCPDVTAANFTFKRGRLDFPADHLVSAEQFRHDACGPLRAGHRDVQARVAMGRLW